MIDWQLTGADATLAEIHAVALRVKQPSPNPDRAPGNAPDVVPSASPLSVSIDGPGLFIFQDGAQRSYGRLGSFRIASDGALTDADGRVVLGLAGNDRGARLRLQPIIVPAAAVADGRFTKFSIAPNGVLTAQEGRTDARSGISRDTAHQIGRVALAVFPAPERLAQAGAVFAQTKESGAPFVCAPGDVHAGTLRPRSLESGIGNLKEGLEQLWLLRRRAQLQTAIADVDDRCARTALGLVK